MPPSSTSQDAPVTVVSTKGQVIVPKGIRDQRRWSAGTRLVVENRLEGVLLREEPLFAPTRIEDVFGSLPYKGPSKTIAQMDAGVMMQARRRARR